MTNRDYYEVLGVERTAAADEIKRSFKKKAAQLHPDNKDTGDEAAFKELVAAYEVLSDEQKRAIYDRYGAEGLKGGGGGGGGGFDSSFDFGSFNDLSDIFDYFFGGGMRQQSRNRNQPQRGNDLRFDLELDFLEACFGVEKKKITIKHMEECGVCGGNGAMPGTQPSSCRDCGGHGMRRQTTSTLFGQFIQTVPCPTCSGEGAIIEKPCGECKGKGQLKKSKNLEVPIPAGVDNGSKLRVGGGGDQGRKGAPAGDLYVVLHVRPHDKFQREGVNVHIAQPISYSLAALGGELLVETVSGPKVIKVPAGTQSGSVIHMKDLGIPHIGHNNRRGDQFVHLGVETPTKLSDEEKQLLKKLAELRGESLTVANPPADGNSKDGQSLFDVIAGVFKPKGSDE